MSEMMRAICIHRYGGPEVLCYELLPQPRAAVGEVLVRVHAAGVNPVDWKTRAGSVPARTEGDPFPLVLGWDLSGVIEAVGDGVTSWSVGDPVYGVVRFPEPGRTYAEYAAVPADQLAFKPDGIDHLEAAALPPGFADGLAGAGRGSRHPQNCQRFRHARRLQMGLFRHDASAGRPIGRAADPVAPGGEDDWVKEGRKTGEDSQALVP